MDCPTNRAFTFFYFSDNFLGEVYVCHCSPFCRKQIAFSSSSQLACPLHFSGPFVATNGTRCQNYDHVRAMVRPHSRFQLPPPLQLLLMQRKASVLVGTEFVWRVGFASTMPWIGSVCLSLIEICSRAYLIIINN